MKDYSNVSVLEAAQDELAKNLIVAIKAMDEKLAYKRLRVLLYNLRTDADFYSVASHFLQLVGHITSVDNE